MSLIDNWIGKQCLYIILTIIKITTDRKTMNIWICNRSHLSFLNRTDFASWKENKNRYILFSSKTINGSRTSITTCCSNNCQMFSFMSFFSFVSSYKKVLKQVSQEL